LREVVEDGTDNEGHDRVSEKLREGQSWISLQPPETSSEAEFHLPNVGQGVWAGDTLMLRLLYSSGILERLKMFASERVGIVVLINLLYKCCTFWTVLPDCSEVIGCSWDSVFEAIPYDTFLSTRHRCEEIRIGLSCWAIKSEIEKVGFCICASTKINLTSLVKDEDFVERLGVLVAD
jgi:hypothetical protein